MKKAIVLAGTDDHIRLIEILKNRGYYTILVDMADDTPAKPYADSFAQISTRDMESVLNFAKGESIDLIITGCGDTTMPTMAYVAGKMKLTTPFDYETAINVTNKERMKKKMVNAGIPTSEYTVFENIEELENINLEYPLIVKPPDGNGSAGIKKVNSFNELVHFAKEALEVSKTGRGVIEKYIHGLEVNIDAFIGDEDVDILMYGHVRKRILNDNVNLIFQTIIPADISKKAVDNIELIIKMIAKEFNLKNTPILLQTIINGDDVNVIEFSPRIGGASKHKTIKEVTGFDMLNALVDSFLNKPVEVFSEKNPMFYSRNHIYAQPGIFGRVSNIDYLMSNGIIEEFSFFKTKGMEIGENYASKDRIGSFLVKAGSKSELMEKIKLAVSKMEVFDIDDTPIMKKEIFEGEIF